MDTETGAPGALLIPLPQLLVALVLAPCQLVSAGQGGVGRAEYSLGKPEHVLRAEQRVEPAAPMILCRILQSENLESRYFNFKKHDINNLE